MKAILMSIKPKWVAKILNGEKTIEIRKKFPKDYVGWVYIYVTKNEGLLTTKKNEWGKTIYIVLPNDKHAFPSIHCLNGKVVARFNATAEEISYLDSLDVFATLKLGKSLMKRSCLTVDEMKTYLNGRNGTAIHINNLEIFDKPKEISEFYKLGFDVKEYNQAVFCLKNNVHYTFEPDEYLEKYQLTRAPESFCYIEI
ncbi:hypothetical protein IKJ53_02535 [bacterium]|nr:hypothetical protein [bacterium]